MTRTKSTTRRIHLLGHANPIRKDIVRFRLPDLDAYLRLIEGNLPDAVRLTCCRRVLEAEHRPDAGGRNDDAPRIRDLQSAIDDPNTFAIVSAAGGAYFTRILPHLDFTPLAARRSPFWVLGFSEITNLVNIVASYPAGRGVYWLCPNYLGWKIRPVTAARESFALFWRNLVDWLDAGASPIALAPKLSGGHAIRGELRSGAATTGNVRLIGGCLSVLAAMLAGPLSKRLKPDGKWLALEDVGEEPYRLDRMLATLKLAGWFDRVDGLLIGAFQTDGKCQLDSVLKTLRYHLPKDRRLPVVTTADFGHDWPMSPLLLNRPLKMEVRGRRVSIAW